MVRPLHHRGPTVGTQVLFRQAGSQLEGRVLLPEVLLPHLYELLPVIQESILIIHRISIFLQKKIISDYRRLE